MARIRTVKPDFFQHPQMSRLSAECRLLAIGLLQLADCDGRLEWQPKLIDGHVFPVGDPQDINAMGAELEGIDWLRRYEANGRQYAHILTFTVHQRPNKRERDTGPRHPAPPWSETIQGPNQGTVPGTVPATVQGTPKEEEEEEEKKELNNPPTPHGGLFGPVEVKATRKPRTRRSKTHPDAPALFAHFKAEFAATQGKPTSKTLGTFAKAAGPRLEEHGLDACKAVASWAMRSPHSRAKHLRSEGFLSGETLWRPRAVYATFLDWLNDPAHKAARTERVCAMVDEAEVSTVWDYDAMIDKMARWTAETTVPDELRAEARAYFARWKGE